MTENEIAKQVLDVAFEIHRELGPGLLESAYERVMQAVLSERGFSVQRQKTIPIIFGRLQLDEGFRADLIVNDLVLIELKSVKALEPIFSKQTLTYLRVSKLKLGLLINFNEVLLKNGVKRVVNGLEE